jgi:hypothetical protein
VRGRKAMLLSGRGLLPTGLQSDRPLRRARAVGCGSGGAWRWNRARATRVLLLVALLAARVVAAHAGALPPPTGPVILTVTGNIDHTNVGSAAQFDRALLDSLGRAQLRTSTSWTDGTPVFEGIWGRSLLDALGAHGKVAVARALNDYVVEIPLSDLTGLDVLIATRMDGKNLRIRDRGPLWIIYPWDQHPELNSEAVKQRSIWQLNELDIR